MKNEKTDKLIERITRLLAMAGDASSPNEALIAARRARKLMDQHEITRADIESAEHGASQFKETVTNRQGAVLKAWVRRLHSAVGVLHDCHAVFITGLPGFVQYTFRGFAADAIVGKLTFDYLVEACDRACKRSNTYGVSEKNFFRMGFANEVYRRAIDIRRERQSLSTSDGKSLVLVKSKAITKHFGDVETRVFGNERPPTASERLAYLNGADEGSKVGLDKQVEEDEKNTQLEQCA